MQQEQSTLYSSFFEELIFHTNLLPKCSVFRKSAHSIFLKIVFEEELPLSLSRIIGAKNVFLLQFNVLSNYPIDH